jgi:hypothetical protein
MADLARRLPSFSTRPGIMPTQKFSRNGARSYAAGRSGGKSGRGFERAEHILFVPLKARETCNGATQGVQDHGIEAVLIDGGRTITDAEVEALLEWIERAGRAHQPRSIVKYHSAICTI